jgi:hypothetical protein
MHWLLRYHANRRVLLSALTLLPALSGPILTVPALAQTTPLGGLLPSWNDGAAKQAIHDFVRATTDTASPNHVPPEDRIVVFDQDGTLWVEQPMYTARLGRSGHVAQPFKFGIRTIATPCWPSSRSAAIPETSAPPSNTLSGSLASSRMIVN